MTVRTYEEIADTTVAQMSVSERKFLNDLLDAPTDDYKRLVVVLDSDGCIFPRQQAALMLRNTPGVAAKLIGG